MAKDDQRKTEGVDDDDLGDTLEKGIGDDAADDAGEAIVPDLLGEEDEGVGPYAGEEHDTEEPTHDEENVEKTEDEDATTKK